MGADIEKLKKLSEVLEAKAAVDRAEKIKEFLNELSGKLDADIISLSYLNVGTGKKETLFIVGSKKGLKLIRRDLNLKKG